MKKLRILQRCDRARSTYIDLGLLSYFYFHIDQPLVCAMNSCQIRDQRLYLRGIQ